MSNSATKFKETEIGLIPEEWESKAFSDLTINFDNKRKPLSSMQRSKRPGIFPYYGASGIVDYIDEYAFDETLLLISEDGENLKTRKTAVAFFAHGKYWVNNHAHVIKNKPNTDLRFIKYWFDANSIAPYLSGSVQPKLSRSNLDSIEILTPQFSEQKQIAEILSSLDDKIELNRKINANLENLAAALFKKWFVDIGDELTEGWRMGDITDVCDFNPPYKIQKGEVSKYIEMKDLPENGSSIRNFIERPFTSGSKFTNGDTLLARITPCLENGKTGFVDFLDDFEVAWGSTEFIVMHPVKKEYSEFLYILARLNDFREYAIQSMSGTSGRQRVQISSLQNFELTIPDNKTISEFHSVVSGLFTQIKFNKKQSAILSQMRDSLLPRLMSGKIRVQV